NIEFLGREDFQVKIQGYRIELGEIETALQNHQYVEQCVVSVWQQNDQKQLIAYVIVNHENTPHSDELVSFLQTKLPQYMIPRVIFFIDKIPLTVNGKVDKKALPLPDQAQLSNQQEFVAATTLTEIWLVKKWQELLKTDLAIGLHHNFFELGGDSLIATRTATSIRQHFQIDLPLHQFFAHPSIAELANWIEQQDQQAIKVEKALPQIKPDPLHRFDTFPLNDIQQAYWLGRQGGFDLGNVACHFYVEVEGTSIDIQRLNQSWHKLIERHDMLRMVIHADGQQQVLQDVPYYNIPTLDLRGKTPQEIEQQWHETRNHLEAQVLPTEQWPLFELAAHIIDDQNTRIYFSFDLLMGDVWSFLVLSKEWLQLYQEPEIELTPLEVNFRDYVLAEKEILSSDIFNDQWSYWKKRLPSIPNAPDLPLAIKPSEIEKPRFVRCAYVLEKTPWQALKQRAKSAGLTSSLVLCAVYAEVLARYSKQSDFTLNLTLFNRLPLHPQVNEIVGDFTSLLLLEVNYRSDQTFMQRAKQLFKQLSEDLENNQINGMRVMREMGLQQNRNVSMPVVFTSALPIQDNEEGGEWLGKRTFNISQTPQVWLDYQVFEEQGDLILSWDYVDDLFPENMVSVMFDAMTQMLRQLAKSDQYWQQSAFDLLPEYQKQQIEDINQTQQAVPDGLLHSPFFDLAQQTPDSIAIISDELTLSYGELATKSYQIANQLAIIHQPNKAFCVAIVMQKGWQQITACMGVLAAGGTYVPIDSQVPESRLELLLEQIDCDTVLTQADVKANFQWDMVKYCYCVETDFEQSAKTPFIKPVEVSNLAYIIFTSGSTGLPKGVMIDHRGALNTVIDINQRFSVNPNDRVIAISNLNFDLSVYDVFGTLNSGAALVIPKATQERDPAHWVELIERYQVSIWNTVPALMRMLTDYQLNDSGKDDHHLPSLRLALLSGDWIPLDLPEQIKQLNSSLQLISLGGATEASIWSIYYPIDSLETHWKSIPYGKPLANQQFYVLNKALQHCPHWVTGDLYIAGVGLAKGYWKDNEKTQASFFNHPETGEALYRTGDIGRYLADGNIEFLGREDFQVKIQGYRIELGEIETVLQNHPLVEQCVISVGQQENQKQLLGYVIVKQNESTDSDEILKYLQAKLPQYMIPRVILFIDVIPLTINGKVDKKSLPLPDQCELLSQQEFVAASSFTESWLMKKWQKLLNTDQEISIHQNFFELGGDSLIATRTATSIRQKFQIDLPLNQFFAHPNIAELAKWIDQQDKQTAKVERLLPQIKADSLHRFDAFPLNDIQQAYWLGRQGGFDLGNIACHFYVEIEGDSIDIQRLNQAWQKLIERHDMLRMVIHPDGLQQVLEHVPYYNIPTLDLRGQSKQQTDQQWKETRQHLEDQVLPTDRWPLFELAAHIVDEQTTRIYFSFDLLMGDVWSFLILSKECMQLYQQPDAELPSLEINFRDYILAEKEILSSDVFNDQWNYWQKRLPTLPNAPDLPLAGKASDIEKPHFVRFSYTLAKAEWQVLKQRATTARLTSSLVLCAVYAEVLARYSKQNDFTLNLTQFNRLPLHSQVNEIVGDFTSLLLLEVNYRSDQTFMQRAKQLFKQLNEDLENNQINGMRVMREMGVQQNRNVSMPVVFTSALPIQDKAKSSSSPAQTKLIPLRDKAKSSSSPARTKLIPLRDKAKSSSSPARTKLIPLRDNDDNSDDEWLGK
ncbi:MAG: amino acid adenylation domain-containing protein, partial [Methylococcales bacterium]|nr:amino acid adenylation domain-containing protein [Methylococcales bacterium]